MMLLGWFTGGYIDLDPSSSEESQDDFIRQVYRGLHRP